MPFAVKKHIAKKANQLTQLLNVELSTTVAKNSYYGLDVHFN
jgi:hypothetical protein